MAVRITMDDTAGTTTPDRPASPGRRALIAGAAWSVPVVAVAAATPAMAASPKIIDLAITVTSSHAKFPLWTDVTLTYTITNVGELPTNGNLITVRLTRLAWWEGSTTALPAPSGWTNSGSTTDYFQFISYAVINPGSSVQLKMTFSTLAGIGDSRAFTGTITNGSGGDANTDNNAITITLPKA